jgi:HEAT repeat protein
LELVEIPRIQASRSLSEKVVDILDSEAPDNVSWSHADVQTAMLASMTEKEHVTRELLRLLNDPQISDSWRYLITRALRTKTLAAEGLEAALIKRLKDPNSRRLDLIVEVLGSFAEKSPKVIEELAKLKDSQDWTTRSAAIRSLDEIGQRLPVESPIITAALLAALADPVISVRKSAISYLGRQKLAAAVPKLKKHLKSDPCGSVRAVCAWAVYQSTNEVDEPLQVLIELLEGNDLSAKYEAALYLASFDNRAKAAVPALKANATFSGRPPFKNFFELRRSYLATSAKQAMSKILNTEIEN